MKIQTKASTEKKHLNEKEIQSCFTLMNSFWGFDRMVFNLGENLIVDIEKIIEYRKNNPHEVKKLNYNSNQIEDLIIQSREFGRLEIGKIYKKESGDTVNYCLLQLNHGGLNFETLSISAIRKKLINVITKIKQQTGIWIIPTTIRIHEMEISFTFATDAIIHFQTRNLLLRSLSNTSQVDKKVYTKCSTPEDHHILSSKKYRNLLHVLYDKTAKAEHNKQIELDASRKYRIYRYEMTLNEEKIKSEFKTTDLDKLHNDQLYLFVYSVIEKGLSNFKIVVQTSVRDTENKLIELYKEKGKDKYIKTFFETQLNHAMDYLYPLTLDESIFLFIDASKFIKPKNCARTKRNLIKESRKNDLKNERYFLSIMITWQVLCLFSLMLNTLSLVTILDFGCYKSNQNTKLHLFKMPTFTAEEKDAFFKKVIKNKNKDIGSILDSILNNIQINNSSILI